MAPLQSRFEQFHDAIRTDYEMNTTLREKKDIIVERVRKHLAKNNRPSCEPFIQGSYKMKVGISALGDMEYDIDVGLRFSFTEDDHDPSDLRRWVFEAVDGHTETVEEKGPCVRVVYKDGYHVDLVTYAWWDDDSGDEQHRLAHASKGWRKADPPGLVQYVIDARVPFADTKDSRTQTDQFRRVVRYLKRWNDHALRTESDDKPSGLALLLLVKAHLSAPVLSWDGTPDDRKAVELVAQRAAETQGRIVAHKPTPEEEDMFGRLSEAAMSDLKERFARLREALQLAAHAQDEAEACAALRRVFGSDFPCPDAEKKESGTARRTIAPAIVPSVSSA